MKQPYNNPTCEEHKDPYLWNGEWWECGKNGHPMPKIYCLTQRISTGYDESDISVDYDWFEIHEAKGRIILAIPEEIYKQIVKYEQTTNTK